jgi:hypothetical protein
MAVALLTKHTFSSSPSLGKREHWMQALNISLLFSREGAGGESSLLKTKSKLKVSPLLTFTFYILHFDFNICGFEPKKKGETQSRFTFFIAAIKVLI